MYFEIGYYYLKMDMSNGINIWNTNYDLSISKCFSCNGFGGSQVKRSDLVFLDIGIYVTKYTSARGNNIGIINTCIIYELVSNASMSARVSLKGTEHGFKKVGTE